MKFSNIIVIVIVIIIIIVIIIAIAGPFKCPLMSCLYAFNLHMSVSKCPIDRWMGFWLINIHTHAHIALSLSLCVCACRCPCPWASNHNWLSIIHASLNCQLDVGRGGWMSGRRGWLVGAPPTTSANGKHITYISIPYTQTCTHTHSHACTHAHSRGSLDKSSKQFHFERIGAGLLSWPRLTKANIT